MTDFVASSIDETHAELDAKLAPETEIAATCRKESVSGKNSFRGCPDPRPFPVKYYFFDFPHNAGPATGH